MPFNLDSRFKEFAFGFSTPVRVLLLVLNHPRLLLYSLLPVAMTLVLVACTIYALLAGAWRISHHYYENVMGSYANGLTEFTALLVGFILLYFAFHTLSLLLCFFSSPFNDLLAEKTEEVTGEAPIKQGFFFLVRVFFLDFRKTGFSIFLVVCFSVLSFVPILGVFSFFGFAMIETLTFITYPASRRRHGILDSVYWIRKNWASSLGFGFVTMFLFGIPVLNLFALPISVMGGTLLYLKK